MTYWEALIVAIAGHPLVDAAELDFANANFRNASLRADEAEAQVRTLKASLKDAIGRIAEIKSLSDRI